MHSLRASLSRFGWRRRVFAIVVLVTLGLCGLVAVVDGSEMLAAGLDHRIHDFTFSFLFATAAAGVLAQLRTPSKNVAGQLMALLPWVALGLALPPSSCWRRCRQ